MEQANANACSANGCTSTDTHARVTDGARFCLEHIPEQQIGGGYFTQETGRAFLQYQAHHGRG